MTQAWDRVRALWRKGHRRHDRQSDTQSLPASTLCRRLFPWEGLKKARINWKSSQNGIGTAECRCAGSGRIICAQSPSRLFSMRALSFFRISMLYRRDTTRLHHHHHCRRSHQKSYCAGSTDVPYVSWSQTTAFDRLNRSKNHTPRGVLPFLRIQRISGEPLNRPNMTKAFSNIIKLWTVTISK